MGYNKNAWEAKAGIIKDGGYKVLPLSGYVIDEGSTIEHMTFEYDSHKAIRIMGDFIIEQNGDQVTSDDLVEEVKDFYNQLIVGENLIEAKYDEDMSLVLVISTTPELYIKVDATNDDYPLEKWQYTCRNGYLTN